MRRLSVKNLFIGLVILTLALLLWDLPEEYEQLQTLERHHAERSLHDQAERLNALLKAKASAARVALEQAGNTQVRDDAAHALMTTLRGVLPNTRGIAWLDEDGRLVHSIGEPETSSHLQTLFERIDPSVNYFYASTRGENTRLDLVVRGAAVWVVHVETKALQHWLDEAGIPDIGWALVDRQGNVLSESAHAGTSRPADSLHVPIANSEWSLYTTDTPLHPERMVPFATKAVLYLMCAALTLLALVALLRELRSKSAASSRQLEQTTSVLSTIDQPVLLSRTDGELLYLNRRAEIMLGQAPATTATNLLSVLPELADMLAAPYCDVQRRIVTLERAGNVRRYTVERSGMGNHSSLGGYVWVMRDETAALQALATLEETRRRYQDIFEGSGAGLCVLDLSKLASMLKALNFQNRDDYHAWLRASPDAADDIEQRLQVTEANAMVARLLGTRDTTDVWRHLTARNPNCESVCDAIVSALIESDRHIEVEVCVECDTGVRHFWMTARFPERREDFRAVTVSLNDMTSRKAMELSLIEREQFWSGIAYAVPDALYVLDMQSRTPVFSNNRLRRQLGYEHADRFDWKDLLHPDDQARLETVLQEQAAPSRLIQGQVRLRHHNGSWRWFDIREQALEQVDTTVPTTRLIGIAKDITEQIDANESLTTSEQRYRLLAESISDVIFSSDAALHLNYISPSVEQMLGYQPEELLETGIRSIIANPQQIAGLTHLVARVHGCLNDPRKLAVLRQDVRPQHMVIDCLRADGRKVPVEIRVVLMWDDSGHFQGLLGVGRDISRQRRAEKDMRMAATVFEHSTAAILVTDPAGYIVQVNRAFSRITGYESGEILDQSPALLTADRQQANHLQYIIGQLDITGSWEGEVWLKRRNGETYPAWVGITAVQDEEGDLVSYVCFFSDVGERKASEQRIHRLAYYDALTQLPNRTLFQDRLHTALQTAERNRAWVVLMFLDLDRFKPINDSLGHAAGDRMLKDVAQRLSGCVDQEDTVARMGGDEFTLLLRASENRENALTRAIHVAERILGSLSQAFVLEGREFFVTASIGIALSPQDGNELSQLMKNADTAMYHAKEMGKNNFQFYQADMNARALERLELESDLRHALDNEQFQLYYQPQFSGDGKRLTGVEALLRWQHPQRGFISPADFVPVLEELGLVVQVGDWALAEACQQLKRWHRAKVRVPKVSVNISARQFGDGQLRSRIARILENSGLPPSCLELELTESILMHDVSETMAMLDGLKKLGICIAVDDFGTGYSSLNYLKQFPIDVLKIDRTFVDGLPDGEQDAQIARAIIAMAHSLNLSVIAEGVETQEQLDFLREHGCDEVQGFLFGRPMPPAQFETLYSNDSLFILN
ncbi:bifunctional diguanylate cyclase/phosphodiesterase [Pseudomonas matsuisoli]|uniref:cyclic-guanylate-specific phosphodiesterase n=1 Tax=Pseudomonas matsuisoli TaxID=1515666 RepID=A0A917UZJ2_9PSED|nr:bifunctional diguanylate cyclase/phosphodiesterase [Pseudomonas matsuisoli]GGK00108.1 motility regulator [Pseudomonas matsuisoli]